MMNLAEYQYFEAAIRSANTILLCTHVTPDGDGIGSMLGLKHYLAQNFTHLSAIDAVISGSLPKVYQFLPGHTDLKNTELYADALQTHYDLAIALDCGSLERLGPIAVHFSTAKYSVNIDHHFSNTYFAELNLVDTEASATGQVLFDLLMCQQERLHIDIATCLYTALLNDTGGFKYANTNARVFTCAAKLVESGAIPAAIYHHLFEKLPKIQILLHAKALQMLQSNQTGTLYWACVPYTLLQELHATEEHIEGLVEKLCCIDGIQIAAVFREPNLNVTKVSLRSLTNNINVANIAQQFGGGGHAKAAGCTIEMPLSQTLEHVIPYLHQLLIYPKSPTA